MTLPTTSTSLCACGHALEEHADSGWGPQTVCTHKLDDEDAGWYGVCPCVNRGDEDYE